MRQRGLSPLSHKENTMNAIVAVDRNWGIGKDNDLLCHLPGDLKYYKNKTTGKIIIVGQRTLESFPGGRPLPNRTNIVLTDIPDYEAPGCIVCHSKEEVLQVVQYLEEDIVENQGPEFLEDAVFVCGGASIYRLFLDDVEKFYVTKMDAEFDADTFFPNLEEEGMRITWESEPQEDNGISYRFTIYER